MGRVRPSCGTRPAASRASRRCRGSASASVSEGLPCALTTGCTTRLPATRTRAPIAIDTMRTHDGPQVVAGPRARLPSPLALVLVRLATDRRATRPITGELPSMAIRAADTVAELPTADAEAFRGLLARPARHAGGGEPVGLVVRALQASRCRCSAGPPPSIPTCSSSGSTRSIRARVPRRSSPSTRCRSLRCSTRRSDPHRARQLRLAGHGLLRRRGQRGRQGRRRARSEHARRAPRRDRRLISDVW